MGLVHCAALARVARRVVQETSTVAQQTEWRYCRAGRVEGFKDVGILQVRERVR